ncbi:MAG: L-2-amino-thiazoline-4-carboxylic acid hydrolase [Alphaproteobacteria bacterium]|jgi:hypothetical protein|nr:L-2-amino-thiazoline-4-carboxylic acid hydrolase [Alphaproteobacteria bacterium]MDP6811741.1 L-2-amino-thiazoline-4-carboxylic acid hydrolase [Alphaproteobacteria bacterium]
MTDLPIIHLRRIEANIIKPIYEAMVAALGEEKARKILQDAIVKNAVEQGRGLAAQLDRPNDLAGFASLLPNWSKEDALRIEVLEQSDESFDFNVTRCRYAEMYREMGLAEIGHILSCGRDGAMCQGFNPDIDFQRSQTIMQGAPHCDFRHRLNKAD